MKNKEQDKKRIAFKKGIISMVFSRFGIVLVLLALQILVLLDASWSLFTITIIINM